MSVFTQAIYNRLVSDLSLISRLASYKGQPAVFTIDPVPANAVLPYVVVSGPTSDVPFDTKTTEGREMLVDVRCYTDDNGSKALVEDIAERVRELFHRQKINVTGYDNLITVCNGPIFMTEDGAYGMIVTIRFKFKRRN